MESLGAKKDQDLDGGFVEKIRKKAETLLENETEAYRKGLNNFYNLQDILHNVFMTNA